MNYFPDDRNLASIAKMLPAEAMKVWCDTANQAAEMGLEHNGCVLKAWEEVSKSWQRPPTGKKWIAKDDPGAGDVHVDAPLGSDGKRKKIPVDDEAMKFETSAQVFKVDKSLGLVFGWAVVCKINGEDYYDLNVDRAGPHAGERVPEHIPEDAMTKAALGLMEVGAPGNDMHAGPDKGYYPFVFPLTTDIAKAMGIETNQTGLMVGFKPPADLLAKYLDGTYTGFSIEGSRITNEMVD
jgi:hypothetical protein